MTFHGEMLTKQDAPRLQTLKDMVREFMLEGRGWEREAFLSQDEICAGLVIRFDMPRPRADSIRRMIGYLRDDGYIVLSRRREGSALAEYRVEPKPAGQPRQLSIERKT